MSEVTTEPTEIQNEEAELQAAMAGYNKTRGDEPPVETPVEAVEPEDTPVVEEEEVEPPAPEQLLATELAELKGKVAELQQSKGDPDAVRKLHGEIGNINRTLKQLQSAKDKDAPADDEVAAALSAAEKAAEEFPELAGPIVKALKVLEKTRATASPQEPVDIDERVTSTVASTVAKLRQQDAIEALAEEHPDFRTVRDTPEFKAWLAKKTPEFQERFQHHLESRRSSPKA
jgi:hypothetical protein